MVILQIQRGSITWDWGPVIFIPAARSTIYGTNSVHFPGSLIWNKLPNLFKSSRSISGFKNIIKKIGNIDYGCMTCKGSTFWANFHRNLVFLCVLSDHADASHLILYCSQLSGWYVICKNSNMWSILDIDWGCATFSVTLCVTSVLHYTNIL